MPFQSTVRTGQGFGVVGEVLNDGPLRAQPYQIDPAAVAADCVVGRMFSVNIATGRVVPGSAAAAPVQGTNALVGILANPKVYAAAGTQAGGTLAPTLLLTPGTNGEFVTMGFIVLEVTGPAVVGDSLEYNLTTGAIAPKRGAATAGSALIAGASVDRVIETGAVTTLIVARLTA